MKFTIDFKGQKIFNRFDQEIDENQRPNTFQVDIGLYINKFISTNYPYDALIEDEKENLNNLITHDRGVISEIRRIIENLSYIYSVNYKELEKSYEDLNMYVADVYKEFIEKKLSKLNTIETPIKSNYFNPDEKKSLSNILDTLNKVIEKAGPPQMMIIIWTL